MWSFFLDVCGVGVYRWYKDRESAHGVLFWKLIDWKLTSWPVPSVQLDTASIKYRLGACFPWPRAEGCFLNLLQCFCWNQKYRLEWLRLSSGRRVAAEWKQLPICTSSRHSNNSINLESVCQLTNTSQVFSFLLTLLWSPPAPEGNAWLFNWNCVILCSKVLTCSPLPVPQHDEDEWNFCSAASKTLPGVSGLFSNQQLWWRLLQ